MSELSTAISGVVGIVQIVKGAIEARDWAKLSEVSAKLNDQIIKAQQAIIDAQAAQTNLVTQLSDAHQKIRELETAAAEQARHSLEEVAPGKFALRIEEPRNVDAALGLNTGSQTKKYACQPCFALLGKSIVLRFEPDGEYFPSKYVRPHCNATLVV